MPHNSVSDMLREMGDKEAADAIDLHKECHKEIAELCGKIADLEEQLAEAKAQSLKNGKFICKQRNELAHKDKVIEVLARDRERLYLITKNAAINIPQWAIDATIKWAEAKAKETE